MTVDISAAIALGELTDNDLGRTYVQQHTAPGLPWMSSVSIVVGINTRITCYDAETARALARAATWAADQLDQLPPAGDARVDYRDSLPAEQVAS